VGKGVVAVKKLSRTSDLPETKFHREVECLMKAKHKNIVRFLGYCSEVQGRIAEYEGKFVMADIRNWLLCFEYVPNGSLDKYITGMIVKFIPIFILFIKCDDIVEALTQIPNTTIWNERL
jgi:serine/threonine protein kinase